MFKGCNSLINLDISNFNFPKKVQKYGLFKKCNSLIKNKFINKY